MSSPRNLDLDLLRAFLAVVETGSFTTAAPIIGRSQSAISQKIFQLESVTGQQVFSRNSRKLHLTEAGNRLLIHARETIKANDAFVATIRSSKPARRLRLGISDNLIRTQIVALVSAFVKNSPGIILELSTGISHDLSTLYERRELDAIIVRPRDDLALNGRTLWREPMVWAAADNDPIDSQKPTRLVTLAPPCNYRDIMTNVLNATGKTWSIVCVTNSLNALDAAVGSGLGVTAFAQSFLRPGLKPLIGWPPLPDTQIMMAGNDSPHCTVVSELEAFLAEHIRGTPLLENA